MIAIDDDTTSTFSYDGEADPDTFSLHELRRTVNAHFGTICDLDRLAEGGYHKVYEIKQDGASLGVVRVAAPAFPKDKLESEVATIICIAAQTNVPVPQVYHWNSDASNPVGAEYMILQKIRGVPANTRWDVLSSTLKDRVVSQVAHHLKALFELRFDRAGSLYLTSPSQEVAHVGPIVSTPFYRTLDGVVRISDADLAPTGLSRYRGPFSSTSEYLQSFLLAELHIISNYRSTLLAELDNEDENAATLLLERGQRTLRKALELCSIYPGDRQSKDPENASAEQFSIKLDDFRLSNIMIDEETGDVTGLIDFESTTVAPLWECAFLPRWLQDPDDPGASGEGGSAEERKRLRHVFWEHMTSEGWRMFYKRGKPFRLFSDRLTFQIAVWSEVVMEEWVNERLTWAKANPGVDFLQDEGATENSVGI